MDDASRTALGSLYQAECWQRARRKSWLIPLLLAVMPAFSYGQSGEKEKMLSNAERCAKLGEAMKGQWPDHSTRLLSATLQAAGRVQTFPTGALVEVPEHCDVVGILHERRGADGRNYAIKFQLRIPTKWNHRLFMQGGAGLNGVVGDAIGSWGVGSAPPALDRGYAVLSQDSGHDNEEMNVPAPQLAFKGDTEAAAKYGGTPEQGGAAAFGWDAQARADYGGASLAPVVEAGKALIRAYHGVPAERSYFVGCSKGGQEAMYLAERKPDLFDGIVAAAPGIYFSRSLLAQMSDIKLLSTLAPHDAGAVTVGGLAAVLSDQDLTLVSKAVLEACDADDGLVDGMVGNFPACTSKKVLPALRKATCKGSKTPGCLSPEQIDVLEKLHEGARDAKGVPLYAGYPWDAGWADPEWRAWKLGSADGKVPSRDLFVVAPALATVLSTPPIPLAADPSAGLAYALGINVELEIPRLYAKAPGFPRSGSEDLGTRATDLSAFRARGGKLIIPQGVSDPMFSIEDTLQWWQEVDQRMQGQASSTVRVFPVPGMAHCLGGPATSDFDTLAALTKWVEHNEAPGYLVGRAGPGTPWPGRTRPVCAYPRMPHYKGKGDSSTADSFECR